MKFGLNISQRLNRDFGKKIERLGKEIWDDLKRIEFQCHHAEKDLTTKLEPMKIDLKKYSSKTASAIDDAIKAIVQGSLEPKR